MRLRVKELTSLIACVTLGASAVFTFSNVSPSVAFAHEKSFPTKQLKALTPVGENLTFKEVSVQPDKQKLQEIEKKYSLTFQKGDLAGSLFMGSGGDKKTKAVALFLDGKSDKGDTEFGASVNTSGKIAKVSVFSSPESSDATAQSFLDSLQGKGLDELEALKKSLAVEDKSKRFIVELTQKALGRVEASFSKK